uniref:Uncharacterized protein n=1 Tax=Amphimedon queenslandica TaxID=400682 RepID=A0A1X7SRL7_AMPQE
MEVKMKSILQNIIAKSCILHLVVETILILVVKPAVHCNYFFLIAYV